MKLVECRPIELCVCLCVCMCLSVCVSVCLSIFLPVCIPDYIISVSLSISSLSVCQDELIVCPPPVPKIHMPRYAFLRTNNNKKLSSIYRKSVTASKWR